MTDYKRLLKIYMDLVGENEGSDFVSYHVRPVWMKPEDWDELRLVASEPSETDFNMEYAEKPK